MSTRPPMEIYMLEDEFERAVQTVLQQNGINDISKQREDSDNLDGTKTTLKTPRVDVKFMSGGPGPNEHYYIVPQTAVRWLDIYTGTLALRIVTRRDSGPDVHKTLRALCRYAMQEVSDITDVMKYHRVEKMIEQQSSMTFEADKLHDVSGIQFQVWLRIRSQFFPTS